MAMADIITDILLVVFPLSILLPATGIPFLRRIRISFLFALSAANIVITAWRVASVVRTHGSQQRRTIFASGEILAAAAVANAVIIASFLRDRGVKRPTWQSDTQQDNGGTMSSVARSIITPNGTLSPSVSVSRTVSRRPTLMTRLTEAGASDEELFAGMCYRPAKNDEDGVDPLDDAISPVMARPAQSISRAEMSRHLSISIPLDDKDMTADDFPPDSSMSASARPGGKTVTFSDPGGLLAKASSRASTVAALDESLENEEHVSPITGRRRWRSISSDTSTHAGTISELQDAGGLLDSHSRRATVDVIPRLAQHKEMMTGSTP